MPGVDPSQYSGESRATVLAYSAAYRLSLGESPEFVLAGLTEPPFEASTSEAFYALMRGQALGLPNVDYSKLGFNRRIPLAHIPTNPELPSAFRFFLRVRCSDPDNEDLSQVEATSSYRNIVINFDANPTRQELEEAIDRFAAASFEGDLTPEAKPIKDPALCFVDALVQVERRE